MKTKLLCFFLLILCVSCGSYIDDTIGKIEIKNGHIQSSKSKNIFYYKNDVIEKPGNQEIKNPVFKVELPKNISKINIVNSKDFLIEFHREQYIFIQINNKLKCINQEFNYQKMDKEDVEYLYETKNILIDNKAKNLKSRMNYIILNEYVSIYLLNIVPESLDRFKSFVEIFTFIDSKY